MRSAAFGCAPVLAVALSCAPAVGAEAVAAGSLLAPLVGLDAGVASPPAPWRFSTLPGQRFPATQFAGATVDGERALEVRAGGSYGNLVHPLTPVAGGNAAKGATLSWRWRLQTANPAIDLSRRGGDDTNLKVCVLFDLPVSAVPVSERFLLQIARQRTGEPLPAATICYVWDSHDARDSTRDNAYSRRVRYWVLRGPADPINRWTSEDRDISADFRRLFGDESATVPPIMSIAVGADADNTGGQSLAFLTQLTLKLRTPTQ